MKNIILQLLSCCLLTAGLSLARNEVAAQSTTALGRLNTDYTNPGDNHTINSFSYDRITQDQLFSLKNRTAENNQFFTKDWTSGSIVTVRNQTFSEGMLFLYDKLNNLLYFKLSDSSETILTVDSRSISSFTINSDKPHTFMPGVLFSARFENKFVEVLTNSDTGYVLLKEIKPGLPGEQISGVAAVTAQESALKYKDEISYYIYHKGVIYPAELKKKSLAKAMANDSRFIELLKKENGERLTENSLQNIIHELNLH